MKRIVLAIVLCAAMRADAAKWSVFVFMNADNNLEEYSFKDIKEMEEEAAGSDVSVVVQWDRAGAVDHPDFKRWSGAVRFRIGDTTAAIRSTNQLPVNAFPADMGSGETLSHFLKWGIATYPAERYAVVMWCHGAGWRALNLADVATKLNVAATTTALDAAGKPIKIAPTIPVSVTDEAFRAASDDHGDFLYNGEIVEALGASFGKRKVHLLVFDSCLMQMIETVYAFRDRAEVLVGSEELVPGTGLDYSAWLKELVSKPAADAIAVANSIVKTYKAAYPVNKTVTMSAVDLSAATRLKTTVSAFADALSAALPAERNHIVDARNACWNYDPWVCNQSHICHGGKFHYIDLVQFADAAAANVADAQVHATAAALKKAVLDAVGGRRYAGADRDGGKYGSFGLSIYFPMDVSTFENDPWNDHSYDKPVTNMHLPYPVAFVTDANWSDFLHAFYYSPEIH
jgi:hypothetical protein